MTIPNDPQNPSARRAYVVRPRPELAQRLIALDIADEIDFVSDPTVVMTESLPFEGKLEGYRSLILKKCKEAYIAELFEFEPYSDPVKRVALLGVHQTYAAVFDTWWTVEEVSTIEIETTW